MSFSFKIVLSWQKTLAYGCSILILAVVVIGVSDDDSAANRPVALFKDDATGSF